jgi:hypothetical protein
MLITKFDNPHEAVFLHKYSKGNCALFKNQIELASEIQAHPDGGFKEKNINTVKSAVSQIFTGERNLSKSLKHVLFLVIKARFNDSKYDYNEFERVLIENFVSLHKDRIDNKRNPDIDYDTLIAETKKGKEFLITTMEPAELHKSDMANDLKDQLLEKTQIVPSDSTEEFETATYKFYFPHKEGKRIAREFWERLRTHAILRYNQDPRIIDAKLKKANEEGIILTYLAPSEIAMHPYVFINYKNRDKVSGFCVSYRNGDTPSVAELSLKVVYEWFDIYEPKITMLENSTNSEDNIINFIYEPK